MTATASATGVEDLLWQQYPASHPYTVDQSLYLAQAMEQYKLYVATTEGISNRRALANTFFVALQAAFVTAIGIAYEPGWHFEPRWLAVFPFFAMVITCAFWWLLIRSYRKLNAAKFKVIEAYEKRLATAPLVATEWNGIIKKDSVGITRYLELTEVERWVPGIFVALYVFGLVAISIS
jgi:hypothetical protein